MRNDVRIAFVRFVQQALEPSAALLADTPIHGLHPGFDQVHFPTACPGLLYCATSWLKGERTGRSYFAHLQHLDAYQSCSSLTALVTATLYRIVALLFASFGFFFFLSVPKLSRKQHNFWSFLCSRVQCRSQHVKRKPRSNLFRSRAVGKSNLQSQGLFHERDSRE